MNEPKIFSNPETEDFKKFIELRKNYLDRLYDLPKNWISGDSDKPNNFTIEISKTILDILSDYLIKSHLISKTKILMSPIPSGGIGIEINIDDSNSMIISSYNNKTIEIEYLKNNHYHEHKPLTNTLDLSNINNTIIEILNSLFKQ